MAVLLKLYAEQNLGQELDVYGWMMSGVQNKIQFFNSVILLVGESTTVTIVKMLVLVALKVSRLYI